MRTPGPWRIREMIDDSLAIYGEGEYELVFPRRGNRIDDDVKLIVAAPELLQALQLVPLGFLEEWGFSEEAQEIRAAIKKATED